MQPRLNEAELGYALAVIDSIGRNSSVNKKGLAEKFPAKILTWLAEKGLIKFSTLIVEGETLEARTALGKRARALNHIDKNEKGEMRIDIMRSINEMEI